MSLLVCFMLVSCNPGVEDSTPIASTTSPPAIVLPSEPSEQPDDELQIVTLWIPPLLAPETPAGSILVEHLRSFEDAYALIKIDIRVKEASGPSGILETLSSANLVAPSILPEIVLLDPANMNSAALKGIILPLDEIIPKPEPPEWYPFAIDAAFVDNIFYGVPFMSEAEAFAYRKDFFEAEPKDWTDLLDSTETILLPMGDKSAKFTLVQYIASDGELADEKGSPTIDPAILTELFMFYLSANKAGQLPLYALQLHSAKDTWLALTEGNTNAAVIPVEALRETLAGDTYLVAPWPTSDGTGVIPTSTLSWAVVAKDDEQHDHVSQILQWLTEPTFLGRISESLGLIPAAPAALQQWSDEESSAILSRLIRVAVSEPTTEEVTTFGSSLWTAIEDVLNGRSTPETAAESIADQVTIP
jgi:ABC-type glycerol-3-phosphate transport system substrate-binding protein